jgi:hypothetical protein
VRLTNASRHRLLLLTDSPHSEGLDLERGKAREPVLVRGVVCATLFFWETIVLVTRGRERVETVVINEEPGGMARMWQGCEKKGDGQSHGIPRLSATTGLGALVKQLELVKEFTELLSGVL